MSSLNQTSVVASLQGIPPEIRTLIYAQMSPPLESPIRHFRGIVLSCKELHHEAEGELIRNMTLFLTDIQAKWDEVYAAPLRIKKPTSIPDIEHVDIAIPVSVVRAHAFATLPSALVPLVDLHVSSLTFSFYIDEKFENNSDDAKIMALVLIATAMHIIFKAFIDTSKRKSTRKVTIIEIKKGA